MKKERASVLRWFKNTPGAILSNVGILTTGFDEPTVETVILYRATTSVSLYLQMVGRGSRTTDTKKRI
ncbi:DEAD/DEAH box helicase [Maribacter dokdonensis]|uniref:DEAD/DEAH box helicase n=1 Tax=Maribacter dokdonensis TaxID=320912 RepID=UPI000B8883F7|nr:helicase-related protein [Maribacter dokdonensis]